MSNPFRFLDSINWTKEDLIKEGLEKEEDYKPFLINRALSYHVDSIFEANDVNGMSHLPGIMQYHYLINSLPKKKRFAKWAKADQSDDVEAIMEYFGYSRAKAEEALRILSDDVITMIHNKLDKGGVRNERKSNKRSSGDKTKNSR